MSHRVRTSQTSSVILIPTVLALVSPPRAAAQPQSSGAVPPPTATAPAQWELTGEDARRVEEWEQTVAQLKAAGQFTAALTPARSILELRTSWPGEGERGVTRKLTDLPASFVDACRALQARPGIATIKAVSFPVLPRGTVVSPPAPGTPR